ncbi:MAG: hypothetical protein NC110_00320 [Ruminococcus sp.]|nr:hypothetical protein [Ruminococcus sp.]MCM1543721.1 hypothetical protein [Ruminococcus sp.]
MTHGQPKPIEKDNDGSTIVRLDINPEMGIPGGDIATAKSADADPVQIGWSCFEVRTFNAPTKANLKKAIIRAIVDETAEFDLVNSYNKHVMGIKVDEEAVQRYKEFLAFTEELDAALVESLKN